MRPPPDYMRNKFVYLEGNMSQIGQVGNGGIPQQQQQIQQAASRPGAGAPPELQGARPSRGAVIGRIFAGIFTLGLSEGILAMVRHARAGSAPAPRVAAESIPPAPPRADMFNRELATSLLKNELPPAYRAAVNEALGELRARFGADVIPEGVMLGNWPGGQSLMFNISGMLRAAADEVSPQVLRAMVDEQGMPLMAKQVLECRIGAYCEEIGFAGAALNLLRDKVLEEHPELDASLAACANRADADAVLEPAMPALREFVQLRHAVRNAEIQAKDGAVAKLAQATGLSEAVIRERTNWTKLESSFTYLRTDIFKGEKPLHGDELNAAFKQIADKFAQQKTELFNSADGLGLSARLADSWKEDALKTDTLSRGDMFREFHAAGSGIDASSLLAALNAPAGEFTDEEIFGLIESLAMKIHGILTSRYSAAEWAEIGADGQNLAQFYAAQAMLDAVPGLAEALAARPRLVEGFIDRASEQFSQGLKGSAGSDPSIQAQSMVQRMSSVIGKLMLLDLPASTAEHNDALAASLGKAEMSLPHLQALDHAIADMRERFGTDCLPAGDAGQALRGWDSGKSERVSSLLSKAVRASETPVSSRDMAALFNASARGAAAYGAFRGLLNEMAQGLGLQLEPDQLSQAALALRQRHPELADAVERAENRAALAELLRNLPDAPALLRLEHDVKTAWDEGMAAIFSSMSRTTGLPEAEVRQLLDLREIDQSGKFGYLRQDIRERSRDRSKAPDGSIPENEIRAGYQRIVDTFLAGKEGLWTSVERLGLSPELAARRRSEILTSSTLKKAGFLQSCSTVAERMDASGLRTGLGEPGLSNIELFGLFRSLGAQLDERAHAVFSAEEFRDMGSDELSAINRFAREAFLDRNHDLQDSMRAQSDRMRVLFAEGEELLMQIQTRMGRVSHESPEMAALQAEYASVSSAMSIISTVVNMEE